jgi:hypothetical protein
MVHLRPTNEQEAPTAGKSIVAPHIGAQTTSRIGASAWLCTVQVQICSG